MSTDLGLDKMLRDAEAAQGSEMSDPWWTATQLGAPAQARIEARDAIHIANCDPPTIIALIERLERTEWALREIAKELQVLPPERTGFRCVPCDSCEGRWYEALGIAHEALGEDGDG